MRFDPPIDGVGFFLRDASTDVSDVVNRDPIVRVEFLNPAGDIMRTIGTDWQTSTVQDRRGDVLYMHLHQDTCDPTERIASITFSNVNQEDVFSIDDITVLTNGARCDPGSISGYVFADSDNDGTKDLAEQGIGGVTVFLVPSSAQCTDSANRAESTTTANGFYEFTGLGVGEYKVCQKQKTVPDAYWDGKDEIGSLGGSISNATYAPQGYFDIFTVTIGQLAQDKNGQGYNFGEIPRQPCVDNPLWCYQEPRDGQTVTYVSGTSTLRGTSIDFADHGDENCNPPTSVVPP